MRPFWRTLAFFTGVFVLVFGIIGFVKSTAAGLEWFAQDDLPTAIFMQANPAFSLLSIVVGGIITLGVIIGRNVDRWINLAASVVFLLVGMGMLAVLRTDLNYFGFTMATCITSFVVGTLLGTAGLYGKVGSEAEAAAEEEFRHATVPEEQGTAIGKIQEES